MLGLLARDVRRQRLYDRSSAKSLLLDTWRSALKWLGRGRDIVWDFDGLNQNFLGVGAASWDDEPRISSFQAYGRNESGKPILNVNSYIRSDLTNETKKVFFVVNGVRVDPAETNGIARDGDFQVASEVFSTGEAITRGPEGMPANRFRNDFGPFTLVFEYDGKSYIRSFTLHEIDQQISEWRRAADNVRRSMMGPAGVTRKR